MAEQTTEAKQEPRGQATAGELLLMDLIEPYAKHIKNVFVSKDLKRIEVVVDRDCPIGAVCAIESRIKEFPFFPFTSISSSLIDNTVHLQYTHTEEFFDSVAKISTDRAMERRS